MLRNNGIRILRRSQNVADVVNGAILHKVFFFSFLFFSVSLLKSGENVRNRINSYSWQHCNALARPSSWISTTKKFSMSRAPSNSRSYIDCVEQNQWKNFGWWPSVISSIWMNIFVSACWCQFNSPIDLKLNLEWMLRQYSIDYIF